MEARIEAVEEELRQEKQKNASLLLQQSQTPPHPNTAGSCQENLPAVSQSSCNGKKAKTTSFGGSGDDLEAQVELKERGSPRLEVNKVFLPRFTLTLICSEEKE